jgi:hypothetical protein
MYNISLQRKRSLCINMMPMMRYFTALMVKALEDWKIVRLNCHWAKLL